nr:MBL fold metallo-hydrolase [Paeniglutamicibacter kerguelensis]
MLKDGGTIDSIDYTLEVTGTPGHSPGSNCLYDRQRRWSFTGDTMHEGRLLDTINGANPADYRLTMDRLLRQDVTDAFAGHGPVLNAEQLRAIADEYLERV